MRVDKGNALLVVAVTVFVIGLVATATMFVVPAVDHGHKAPILLYGLSMLTPVGFLLGLVFALLSGRRDPAVVVAGRATDATADGHRR